MTEKSLLTDEQKQDIEKCIDELLKQKETIKIEREELKDRTESLVQTMRACQQDIYTYRDMQIILETADKLKFNKLK